MQGGDISNDIVPRWLVTFDALLLGNPMPTKKWNWSWGKYARLAPINPAALGRLHQFTRATPARFEAVTFDYPDEFAESLEQVLDRLGSPIVWVSHYPNWQGLQTALAFRPEVVTVVDIAANTLRWGSRGLAITNLH